MSDTAPAGTNPPAASLQAAETAAAEAEKAAALAEANVDALKAEQLAEKAVADAPLAIEVGCTVTLASGRRLTVRGVRRGPAGIALLGPGDAWIDGTGAVVIGATKG